MSETKQTPLLTREEIIRLTAPDFIKTTKKIEDINVVDAEEITCETKQLIDRLQTELTLRRFYNFCLVENLPINETTIDKFLKLFNHGN